MKASTVASRLEAKARAPASLALLSTGSPSSTTALSSHGVTSTRKEVAAATYVHCGSDKDDEDDEDKALAVNGDGGGSSAGTKATGGPLVVHRPEAFADKLVDELPKLVLLAVRSSYLTSLMVSSDLTQPLHAPR